MAPGSQSCFRGSSQRERRAWMRTTRGMCHAQSHGQERRLNLTLGAALRAVRLLLKAWLNREQEVQSSRNKDEVGSSEHGM